MQVWEWLKQVGGRVGLLHFLSTTSPAPPERIPTRTVTLRELMKEVGRRDARALEALPAELSVSLDQIFAAAGMASPPHGWTIERLGKLLREEPYQRMSRPAVQKAILELLAADEAHVQDLVKDAVTRDQALDAFAAMVRAKMNDLAAAQGQRLAEIDREIRELQTEAARLREETQTDAARWRDWRAEKAAREKEMAWALGYLLSECPITVDEEPPARPR